VPFHRTDDGKITYPKGISAQDRRFCRRVYDAINDTWIQGTAVRSTERIIVACSGGIDSTVLAHAFAMAKTIDSSCYGKPVEKYLVYVNHQLRPQYEIENDIGHVTSLGDHLGYQTHFLKIDVPPGNVQAKARETRYTALTNLAEKEYSHNVLLGHHANDVVETKLWQFLTGREVVGIPDYRELSVGGWTVYFHRPLLSFTRNELELYRAIWNLPWQEDSSNATTKYTRNRIRQELIPWIEKNVNPSIVKMLSQKK
jgi:tRNA(Ile)-lysidine synthase